MIECVKKNKGEDKGEENSLAILIRPTNLEQNRRLYFLKTKLNNYEFYAMDSQTHKVHNS